MLTVETELSKPCCTSGESTADKGEIFCDLVNMATEKDITVRFAPLPASFARIKGDRIAISQKLQTIDEINYNLAHELAHRFLHYDKGNIMESANVQEYEEQADRGAKMLLEALAVCKKGGAA